MPVTSLLEAIQGFQNLPKQRDAIDWLERSTGEQKRREFALRWRNVETNAESINFVNVFRYYNRKTHQQEALAWLQANSQAATITEFLRLYNQASQGDIILKVKWDSQMNSRYPAQAARMCFSSTVWMCMSYISPRFAQMFRTDDDWLDEVLRYGDTTSPIAQGHALHKCGFKSVFRTDCKPKDIVDSLKLGRPVGIGVLHKGSIKYPAGGGHWLAIGGVRADESEFLAFDPFGSLVDKGGAYTGAVSNGNGYWLSRKVLNGRWTPEDNHLPDYGEGATGWAMFFED